MYMKILDIRPGWEDKVQVVMTGNNNDPEDWKDIIGNNAHKKEISY